MGNKDNRTFRKILAIIAAIFIWVLIILSGLLIKSSEFVYFGMNEKVIPWIDNIRMRLGKWAGY